MKTTLLFLLLLGAAIPSRAQSDPESAKSESGTKFLETGGQGGVSAGTDVSGESDPSKAERANALTNGTDRKLTPDKTEVPTPKKGDALSKAVGAAKGAVIGGVVLGTVGGVVGAIGGPAGILGGAMAGAKLGIMVGMAVGAGIGWLLGGKEASATGGALESRQNEIDKALKGL